MNYASIVEKTIACVDGSMREICALIEKEAEKGSAHLTLHYYSDLTSGQRLWLREKGYSFFYLTKSTLIISWEHDSEDKERVAEHFIRAYTKN